MLDDSTKYDGFRTQRVGQDAPASPDALEGSTHPRDAGFSMGWSGNSSKRAASAVSVRAAARVSCQSFHLLNSKRFVFFYLVLPVILEIMRLWPRSCGRARGPG